MFSGSIHLGCLQKHSSETSGSLITDVMIPLPVLPVWQSVSPSCCGSDLSVWKTEEYGTGVAGSFSSPISMNQMVKPGHFFAEVFPHQPYWKCPMKETPMSGILLMPNTQTAHICS